MKALVLEEYNRLAYQDVPMPQVGPSEVLTRIEACGICGSDIHGLDGRSGRRIPPVIMGHEASGVIVELGQDVHDWQIGDRITFDSTIYCGACHYCRQGQINLCDSRRVFGVSCDTYRQDGAFAEYLAVPERILYRLPEGLTFEHATLVEALSIAVHAVGRVSIPLGCTAVVVGTGMIGLLVVQVLRAAGCGQIFAIDLDARRLDMACCLGADQGLKPDTTDVVKHVLARTGSHGADLVFEAVGAETTLDMAIRCARKGGSVVLVGNLTPLVSFPLQSTVTREISLFGSCASSGEYPVCLDMLVRGIVDVDSLISSVAPLAEGAALFRRLYIRDPGLLKVILKP